MCCETQTSIKRLVALTGRPQHFELIRHCRGSGRGFRLSLGWRCWFVMRVVLVSFCFFLDFAGDRRMVASPSMVPHTPCLPPTPSQATIISIFGAWYGVSTAIAVYRVIPSGDARTNLDLELL